MKFSKTLTGSLAVTALAASVATTSVNAEEFGPFDVSASAGVANMYLWRGFDLGNSDAAVFGDITVSAAGFYGTVWTSSGDAFAGQEYDVIVGYGREFGDFFFDAAVINYLYPSYPDDATTVPAEETNFGDFMEAALTLGWGPVSLTYLANIEAEPGSYAEGLEDYSYFTASASIGAFGLLVGRHDNDMGDNPVHLDLSYAYNDNLSFTVSKMVADEENVEHDAHFLVSYSLPIE